jgi:hypothetical protein
VSIDDVVRVTPDWLALREPADAEARAVELLTPLRAHLTDRAGADRAGADRAGADRLAADRPELVVHDLGCGTGSMGRWLAGRLPGVQRWIMQDRDPDLLAVVAADPVGTGIVTREADVTALTAADLAGTSLVTTSALLDLLTAQEVDGIAEACVTAGVPALLTLSVVGQVDLTPADPLDAEITAAFNDHQRRVTGGRRLLGPDAVDVTADAFLARGAVVLPRPSPWRLGPADTALTAEWLRGWVGAARAQRPDLAPRCDDYLRRRLDECAAGELRVVVHHCDLLALPTAGTST